MPRRYVAKTYNNRRALRIIFGTIIGVLVAIVATFLILFFTLERYIVHTDDGSVKLEIPWLMD
jgi:uncharacterized protein YqgC (DUF456 family)